MPTGIYIRKEGIYPCVPRTKEHKRKIGNASVGRHVGKRYSEEHKRRISEALMGRPRPDLKGEKCNLWRGGISLINRTERQNFANTIEYKGFRWAVFKRDNFTCKMCGQYGGNLCVHHVKPYALFPNLRLEINNGETLCRKCHYKTDSYGGTFSFNRQSPP